MEIRVSLYTSFVKDEIATPQKIVIFLKKNCYEYTKDWKNQT